MTISEGQRRVDFEKAVQRLIDRVGDRDVREVEFGPDDAMFEDLLPATFAELLRLSLVEWFERPAGRVYRLNHNGWASALVEILRAEEDEEFQLRKGQFCKAAKDFVKGRRDEQRQVSVSDFATAAQLPPGWCWNAIRGNLFCRVKDAPRYGQLRYSDTDVIVPTTWGQWPLR